MLTSRLIAVVTGVLTTSLAAADPIDRPLTLPERTFAAVTDLYASHRSVTVGGITASSTSEAARLAIGYGITDHLQLELALAFSLHHFQTDQPLTLAASYAVLHRAGLELGITAGIATARDPREQRIARIELGIGVRYTLGDFALYAGGAGIQSGTALAGTALGPVAPTALGRELVLGLRSPSSFDVPVGILARATPRLQLGLGTVVHVQDNFTIPVELAARVAVSHAVDLTIFGDLADLRTTQLDLLFFGLGVRYYH